MQDPELMAAMQDPEVMAALSASKHLGFDWIRWCADLMVVVGVRVGSPTEASPIENRVEGALIAFA